MDYEALYRWLPKPHYSWTIDDTQTWLDFLGYPLLRQRFEDFAIDGSVLSDLNEEELLKELDIRSRLMRRKLMIWITKGVHEFDRYVTEKESHLSPPEQVKMEVEFFDMVETQLPGRKEEYQAPPKEQTEQLLPQKGAKMAIRYVEQNQAQKHSISEGGATIGRAKQNSIQLVEQSVSRFHACITFSEGNFWIRDLSSSAGTYIRIQGRMQLEDMMIIEMGSNQFMFNEGRQTILSVYEGRDAGNQYFLQDHITYVIGRKDSNQICLSDDQHLSLIHSHIFNLEGVWFIEDIATTNGTWLRLSLQGQRSQPYPLTHKSQFKVSTDHIYECQIEGQDHRQTIRREKCSLCNERDVNCFFNGCRHAVGCFECVRDLDLCPHEGCGKLIDRIEQMYIC